MCLLGAVESLLKTRSCCGSTNISVDCVAWPHNAGGHITWINLPGACSSSSGPEEKSKPVIQRRFLLQIRNVIQKRQYRSGYLRLHLADNIHIPGIRIHIPGMFIHIPGISIHIAPESLFTSLRNLYSYPPEYAFWQFSCPNIAKSADLSSRIFITCSRFC